MIARFALLAYPGQSTTTHPSSRRNGSYVSKTDVASTSIEFRSVPITAVQVLAAEFFFPTINFGLRDISRSDQRRYA
jgi:hypothetical protein